MLREPMMYFIKVLIKVNNVRVALRRTEENKEKMWENEYEGPDLTHSFEYRGSAR